jgi:hypothetical protein
MAGRRFLSPADVADARLTATGCREMVHEPDLIHGFSIRPPLKDPLEVGGVTLGTIEQADPGFVILHEVRQERRGNLDGAPQAFHGSSPNNGGAAPAVPAP